MDPQLLLWGSHICALSTKVLGWGLGRDLDPVKTRNILLAACTLGKPLT